MLTQADPAGQWRGSVLIGIAIVRLPMRLENPIGSAELHYGEPKNDKT